MPTSKEVSKIKSDYISKRKAAINNKLIDIQSSMYDNLIGDFLDIIKKKNDGKDFSLNKIESLFKKMYNESMPDVMKQTASASKSISDLNQMYFATLLDSNKLDEIHNKTKALIDKRLGIDEKGKLKPGGFTDKVLGDLSAQKSFVKSLKQIISTNPDINKAQTLLKETITGSKYNMGAMESFYRNLAGGLLSKIDRSNSIIYANELELKSFYYGGGLIKTSRKMCLRNNGKIFTRDQAESWRLLPEIIRMYPNGDYEPLIDMGGHGCMHTPDWITEDVAKEIKGEQNKKAAEKNKAFKKRNDL